MNNRKQLIAIQTLIISSIAAIVSWRRLVGPSADFEEYYLMMVQGVGSIEPFWELLRYYINFDGDILIVLYGVIALISISFKIPILLNKRFGFIAVLLYLASLFLLHEYTQIRVALGLAAAYVILNKVSTSNSIPAIFIYLIPTLFHYSLIPLVLIPILSRARITIIIILISIYILNQVAQIEMLLEITRQKFGDDSKFYMLNILSSNFFILHAFFMMRLRSVLSDKDKRFHNAALLFVIISIPFGFLQFGTAYFRFQEISASLMIPAIFAGIASKRGIIAGYWYFFVGGYYLMLSAKIFLDLI